MSGAKHALSAAFILLCMLDVIAATGFESL